ncbi:histidine kinase [Terrimonas sp. NA20]|uniref:Histidine kinase n=1 Tax=Terrimonas ginsenosidimutans TaxID=2908004 RepID=A0ABS9KVT2_9BACT|nr:histidine kinase [Terrimonas ginsenosidimutans]MCG2616393.1 histidine kinase [Terrimonas ginsenosidimutans]
MSTIRFKDFFGSRNYFFFAGLLAIPVWIAVNAYVETLNVPDSEAVAGSMTAGFFLSVFSGRFIIGSWTDRTGRFSNNFIGTIAVITVLLVSWLCFHAAFPFGRRTGLNLATFLLPLLMSGFGIGAVAKMIRANTQRQLSEARNAAAQSKGELQLLQSQLSPHFLFNTLNNLYGLSITQHEKIPPLLLRLSDLLRYSVYEAGETYVPLKMEMEYISNYIEFEKIRMGQRLVLETDLATSISADIKIAPMLLIVFVENAFKFAGNTSARQCFIDIKMAIENDVIIFKASNSYSSEQDQRKLPGKNSGMGLTNVYKRLELLYPFEHILNINQEPEQYTIMLQLKARR